MKCLALVARSSEVDRTIIGLIGLPPSCNAIVAGEGTPTSLSSRINKSAGLDQDTTTPSIHKFTVISIIAGNNFYAYRVKQAVSQIYEEVIFCINSSSDKRSSMSKFTCFVFNLKLFSLENNLMQNLVQ